MTDVFERLAVMKRNGKKVDFDRTKVAIAIKKGFDSVNVIENGKLKYSTQDIQKVSQAVLNRIEKEFSDATRIKIETIQDFIEAELKKNYSDVYVSFSEYRERRARSRTMFFDEKKTHQFLKVVEGLGLKSSNVEEMNIVKSPIHMMVEYGNTLSESFVKAYLLKAKYTELMERGDIFIHDLNFYAVGTTTSCQIALMRLYKNGFETGSGFIRPPRSISTYAALAPVVLSLNQQDQHGEQSFCAFDYDMASGVLRTFHRSFETKLSSLLRFSGLEPFFKTERVMRELEKQGTIDFPIENLFDLTKESTSAQQILRQCYQEAMEDTKQKTIQAMESFLYNCNTLIRNGGQLIQTTINLGTDISPEGRMVTKSFLSVYQKGLGHGEKPIYPTVIFKVREGTNYFSENPNHDLLKMAYEVAARGLDLRFSFLDSTFNRAYLQGDNSDYEVAYTGIGERTLDDNTDTTLEVVPGRGTISKTTLNLPRFGLKYGIDKDRECADLEGFFSALEETLDLIRDQLLDRFEIQCSRPCEQFPFLLGQGVWTDGEKAKSGDRLRKYWKHGILSIGFVGLSECLKALTGKTHGESEEADLLGQKIISFLQSKTTQYSEETNLNFVCFGTNDSSIRTKFTELDKAIYGKIKGVTDHVYTESFWVNKSLTNLQKIKKEAPYHALTIGGHLTVVEEKSNQASIVEKNVIAMKESNIGYGRIICPLHLLEEEN